MISGGGGDNGQNGLGEQDARKAMATNPGELPPSDDEDYYESDEEILLDKFGNTIERKTAGFHENVSATKISWHDGPAEAASGFQVGDLCQEIEKL